MNMRHFAVFPASLLFLGALVSGCGGSGDPSAVPGVDAVDQAAAADRSERSGTAIVGRARDAGTGSPLAGVRVATGDRSTTTASDGTYNLALRAGAYTVTATREGYVGASRSATVPRRGTVTVDWSLVESAEYEELYAIEQDVRSIGPAPYFAKTAKAGKKEGGS